MATRIAMFGVLMLTVSIVRADRAAELPFDEEYVCRNEHNDAKNAADRVIPATNDAAAIEAVEKARRDLADAGRRASKNQETYRRRLDEAVARVEASRAERQVAIARRDASAKKLAECVDGERRAHGARVAAWNAEEERKATEAAVRAAAERERIDKLMGSKPTVRLALSALVCATKNDRAAALQAIADEKKYARIGGVQNLSKIYDLQQEVAAADRRTAWLGGELKKRKTTAIKCGDPTVRQIATCIRRAVEDGACLVDEIAGPLQVVQAVEPE